MNKIVAIEIQKNPIKIVNGKTFKASKFGRKHFKFC